MSLFALNPDGNLLWGVEKEDGEMGLRSLRN